MNKPVVLPLLPFPAPSSSSAKWTCSMCLAESPHDLSGVFMVSVSFHKTCYWITARSKDSLSLSHVLSFLSLLPALLLISLSPLNHSSTLPPVPPFCPERLRVRDEARLEGEARKTSELMQSSDLFWSGFYFFWATHTLRHSAGPMSAIISSDRPAFHFSKPVSLKHGTSEEARGWQRDRKGGDTEGWERRGISKNNEMSIWGQGG